MDEGIISSRYALALYKYAKAERVEAKLYEDAKRIEESFKNHPQLQTALINPVLPATDKASLLHTAAGTTESHYKNFISLVIKQGREEHIRTIFLSYQQIYREKNKISQVVITSAQELSQDIHKKIKEIVKTKAEKDIEYEQKIDPTIIGGFILKIDSMQLDASINSELKQLRLKLSNSNKTV